MKVDQILRKYSRPAELLGGEPVKQELIEDLRAQRRFNSRIYGLLFGAVCLVLLVAISAVATDVVNGEQLRTATLAGAGITVPAMLEWMRRVVREWSQLNLLITLVSYESENGIQVLIQKLLSTQALGAASAG